MSKHQWIEVTFGDLFEISSSKRVHQEDWKSAGVPFYRAREIVKLAHEGFVENELFISEELFNEYSGNYGVPKAGDLMVSAVGTLGACYVVKAEDRFYYKDASVLRFSPKQDLCPDFFKHAFRTAGILDQVHSGSGSTVGTYTIQRANATRIQIPPVPEQRRIAAILDQAEAMCAKRRAVLAKLDTLAQSIFMEMFGDRNQNPRGWPTGTIEEVAECLDRFRKPVTESDRTDGDVPYYGANGQQGWMDRALFNEPLVLVAEDGGHFEDTQRGVAYLIDGPAWVNNHAHILRAIPTVVETEYLYRSLRHYDFVPYISGSTRAKLTQGQLNRAKIMVPPLHLQQEFSTRMNALEGLIASSTAGLKLIGTLFASIQHRAFQGEL